MKPELEIRLKELSYQFTMDGLIWNPTFLQSLKELTDEDLRGILLEIEIKVKKNFTEKIYPNNVKNNILNILSYYRDRFTDKDILNKVNELIGYLNSSTSENYLSFLTSEFVSRYMIFSKTKITVDILNFESRIQNSIGNDYIFFTQLLDEDINDFLLWNLCSELGYSSLSYLLDKCPEILFDNDIKEKIEILLNFNIKAYRKMIIITTDKNKNEYECSRSLYKDSKKLIKYIKNYTR